MSVFTFVISDGQARRIASEWHGGMGSALYSLASSGAVDYEWVMLEIRCELPNLEDETPRRELLALGKYVRSAGCRPAQAGWCFVWDDAPVSLENT
jgi:hypothetical protein